MGISEELELTFLETLSKEFSGEELDRVEQLIISELNSTSFKEILQKYNNLDKKTHFIAIGLLLGLGRDRVIEAMSEYNVTRADVERTQKTLNINDEDRKKINEKEITKLKWKTNSRIKRKNALSNVWEDVKEEYMLGISLEKISKKYDTSIGLIKSQLEDENLLDSSRSTVSKKKIADSNQSKIDDEFIINLLTSNPTVNIVDLWKLAKERYPWLLRRQFYSKLDELNLSRSKYEINMAKSARAKKREF